MASKYEGSKFGRLSVLYAEMRGGKQHFHVRCDCGRDYFTRATNVLSGNATQCVKCRNKGKNRTDHPLYVCYLSMVRRCRSNDASYGGRGISVCDRWLGADGFQNFVEDMGVPEGLGKQATLDRIDVNGNYTPENCRWASVADQQRNKRSNVWITVDGVTDTIAGWSRRLGIRVGWETSARKRGEALEDAVRRLQLRVGQR